MEKPHDTTEREIACQQILEHDSSVFSIQWMTLPPDHARGVDPSFLFSRYLQYIHRFTLSLIRPRISADGVEFRLMATNIPLLVGEDGIHGHSFWKGATIFPTQLALAASWNPELLEQVGVVAARGLHPEGREPAQAGGEDDDQGHADDEVRHRVEDEAQRAAEAIGQTTSLPAGIRPEADADDGGDELAERRDEAAILWGTLRLPEDPHNLAWGGDDGGWQESGSTMSGWWQSRKGGLFHSTTGTTRWKRTSAIRMGVILRGLM